MTKDQLADALRRDDATHELRQAPVNEIPGRDTRSFEELTHPELVDLAQQRDIQGRASMIKDELISALRHDDRTQELRHES